MNNWLSTVIICSTICLGAGNEGQKQIIRFHSSQQLKNAHEAFQTGCNMVQENIHQLDLNSKTNKKRNDDLRDTLLQLHGLHHQTLLFVAQKDEQLDKLTNKVVRLQKAQKAKRKHTSSQRKKHKHHKKQSAVAASSNAH